MIRRFLKDSAIYVVPTVLSRGIGLILLPVYTHFLSPDMYGALELLTLLYVLLNLTLPLEITQSVARFMADSDHLDDKCRIASTGYWFTLTSFSLVGVVIFLFPESLSYWVFGKYGFALELQIAAIAMVLNALQYVIQNQLRWQNDAKNSAIVSMVFSILSAGTAITCLAIFEMGLLGVIVGQLVGSLFSLLLGLWLTKDKVAIVWLFDLSLLKKMLLFSSPLVVSNIGVYVATYMDRWLINLFLGLDSVGVYSVAMRLASIVALGTAVFQMSLTPLIYSQYKQEGTPEKIERIFSLVMMSLIPLIGVLAIVAPFIIEHFIGGEYAESVHLVGWLSLLMLLMGSYVFFPGMWIAGKTKEIALINVGAALLNFCANWILISRFGVDGAVAGSILAAFVLLGLYFWRSNKAYAVPYRTLRYVLMIGLLSLFLVLCPMMISSWMQWGGVVILMLVAILSLPHASDKMLAWNFIQTKLPRNR